MKKNKMPVRCRLQKIYNYLSSKKGKSIDDVVHSMHIRISGGDLSSWGFVRYDSGKLKRSMLILHLNKRWIIRI